MQPHTNMHSMWCVQYGGWIRHRQTPAVYCLDILRHRCKMMAIEYTVQCLAAAIGLLQSGKSRMSIRNWDDEGRQPTLHSHKSYAVIGREHSLCHCCHKQLANEMLKLVTAKQHVEELPTIHEVDIQAITAMLIILAP